jgi:hypothetical protein
MEDNSNGMYMKENSDGNGGDEKRGKKPKCHIRKYNIRIKMRKKHFY